MEAPEVEFLMYLLERFIDKNDIDVRNTSVEELVQRMNEELTPIGGG